VLDEADRMLDMGFEPQARARRPSVCVQARKAVRGESACRPRMGRDARVRQELLPRPCQPPSGLPVHGPESLAQHHTAGSACVWGGVFCLAQLRPPAGSFGNCTAAGNALTGPRPRRGAQIQKIVRSIPPQRQTLFFSATWPREVKQIASQFVTHNTVHVFVGGVEEKLVANKAITQYVELMDSYNKMNRLGQILRSKPPGSRMISSSRHCAGGRGRQPAHSRRQTAHDPPRFDGRDLAAHRRARPRWFLRPGSAAHLLKRGRQRRGGSSECRSTVQGNSAPPSGRTDSTTSAVSAARPGCTPPRGG